MPQDRRFQFFLKIIVGYIEVEGLYAPGIGGLNILIKCVVGYIEVEMASCARIGCFNIF